MHVFSNGSSFESVFESMRFHLAVYLSVAYQNRELGGGTNSRIQILIRSKHWISKEINAAEHKYKNMLSPQLTILIRHWYLFRAYNVDGMPKRT